ncbi:nucleotidyl transferase AbiEii/AbiGii toxin family protein, partial [bacterium]|nr:nucleotidyl transferase AbiEii/AbiGii toxin family protein [bacterium]
MKDFYDLDWMARSFAFDGTTLVTSIQATFTRRQTVLPRETPVCLSAAFAEDPNKHLQWQAFLQRSGLIDPYLSLDTVISRLSLFLMPPLLVAAQGAPFRSQWKPGNGWQSAS